MDTPQRETPAGGPGLKAQTIGDGLHPHGNSIDVLLSRLDGVKQTGPGRWIARCPAHQDKSPSLSIKQCDDNVILLHDFGGCGAADILAAVGLELRDLFPRGYGRHGSGPRPDWRRDQLRAALDREELILELARADVAKGKALSREDRDRVLQAGDRVRALREKLHGPR